MPSSDVLSTCITIVWISYLSLYDIYYYCCYLLPSLSPVFSIPSFPHQLRCESSTLWPSCTTSAFKRGTSAQQHAAGVCGGALAQLSPAMSIHVPRSAAQCIEAQNLMRNPLCFRVQIHPRVLMFVTTSLPFKALFSVAHK